MDPRRPHAHAAGDAGRSHDAAPSRPDAAHLAAHPEPGAAARPAPPDWVGPEAARKFVGRVSQLGHEGALTAITAWHTMVCAEGRAWFAAEDAVAQAIVAAGRQREQRPLLVQVADVFAHDVWYGAGGRRGPTPESRARATEASGQYVATLAMLAVLVRDHLEPATFELLYRPFAASIPVEELARE